METSAKENLNINELFNSLAQQMKQKLKEGDKHENKGPALKLESEVQRGTQDKKNCCG